MPSVAICVSHCTMLLESALTRTLSIVRSNSLRARAKKPRTSRFSARKILTTWMLATRSCTSPERISVASCTSREVCVVRAPKPRMARM